VPSLKVAFVLYYLIISSSSSSSGIVPERLAGPPMEGRRPQFPSLPTIINGRVVACVPPKNQFRETKKIPYAMLIYESGTPSWFSCEYSSTPSVLSVEEEVVYPWEN